MRLDVVELAGLDEGSQDGPVLSAAVGAGEQSVHPTHIECCKLQDVEPNAYLTDVLSRLVNGHLQRQLSELTPWAWKVAYPSR